MGARVEIHLGDIRQFVKDVGEETKQFRSRILSIIQEETDSAVKTLKDLASGLAVTKRTGKLAKAADAKISENPYTYDVEIGFINAKDERTLAASHTLTGGSEMPIQAINAEKLAYPVRGKSPSDIIRKNSRGITVQEARQKYYLVFRDKAILGRKLHSRNRKLYFLFARSDEVTIPQYIDLDKEADTLIETINTRLEEEIGTSYGE